MPAYRFYEKVRVTSAQPELESIRGKTGAVLGIARTPHPPQYTVYVYRDNECWIIPENGLEATGEFDHRDNFYDEGRIQVSVDQQGEGRSKKECMRHRSD